MDIPTPLPVNAETLLAATGMVGIYLGAMFLGALLLPGLERQGYPQPDGARETRKTYKLTGMTLFLWTHLLVGVAVWGLGLSLSPLVSHFWSLALVSTVVSVLFSLVLLVQGRLGGGPRAPAGDNLPLPRVLRELWFGTQINPTWLGVDLKMFLYQPSLIGTGLLVLAFAFVQHETHGALTPQMLAFLAFWWGYLWTHYVKEEFMLSTWDVIAENLGLMLVWGDLVYVPFFYSLPGWWIAAEARPFPPWAWLALSAFYLLSLWVFRQANWQKERFKQDPKARIWGQVPETIGGRLLVSGWWGVGRKINYTGEIGVYLAFALCAGVGAWQPYLLPLSLVILLTHRAARDDRKCRAKYSEFWDQYRKRVRFRIFPFVY
jgi:delta14-sterol reductase